MWSSCYFPLGHGLEPSWKKMWVAICVINQSIRFSVCWLSTYPIYGGLDLIYLERPDLRRSIPGGSEDCGGVPETPETICGRKKNGKPPSKGVDQWWNCWFVKSCNRNGCSVNYVYKMYLCNPVYYIDMYLSAVHRQYLRTSSHFGKVLFASFCPCYKLHSTLDLFFFVKKLLPSSNFVTDDDCWGKFLHALDCFEGCCSLGNIVCTGEHPLTRHRNWWSVVSPKGASDTLIWRLYTIMIPPHLRVDS